MEPVFETVIESAVELVSLIETIPDEGTFVVIYFC